MDSNLMEWLNVLFRWLHVVAGVMWIGHLWFFNFVNSQLAKTYDADSKKKVVPELMPRALYFFRWGAAWTWVTGFLLVGIVYYHRAVLLKDMNQGFGIGPGIGLSLALILVSFFVYDALWKSPIGKNETQAAGISFALLVAVGLILSFFFSGRAVFIHLGGIMGTIMAMNVWMRIWPGQRKIIAGIKGTGPAADPAVVSMAGLRSKHNTYMSVPLIFFMISNHWSTGINAEAGGFPISWLYGAIVIALGWGLAKWIYTKSATAAPASF